ncbi:hypothetical protein MSG28_009528 [Choristoneura fumiferana]|uniref:Uncharacterized protein n=1 Tax=Choristoneura fumiferana TaxID=7141 RepID=A0ACC0JBI2_CHOFU|nr:hypothetical protein MSG28_009528 [Choristoneura fumiferana]
MRRTYRSKKETGGGLDHRDVLLSVDEKSSAFDAFYIQNLKQTKRELSCMGSSTQYNATSNKVRKKKFVKRIVKEVENTPRDSISRSAYLTPDKSIRVNKGLDIFDQLLGTTSPQHSDPKVKKVDLFDKFRSGREPKKYGARKGRKIKKFNYSSSDYETDKENESNNVSKNVTDIRAHKLVLEKDLPNDPKHQDESINNIVRNLSIFNNINKADASNSPVISFTYSKKRSKQDASTEEYTIKRKESNDLVNTYNINKLNASNDSNIKSKNCGENNDEPAYQNEYTVMKKTEKQELDYVSVLSDSINESDWKNVSLGGSKPSAPFLGFTVISDEKDDLKANNLQVCVDVSNLKPIEVVNDSDLVVSLGGSKPSEVFFGFSVIDTYINAGVENNEILDEINGTMSGNSSINSQDLESLYDTCNSDKYADISTEISKEPVIKIMKLDDAVFQKYYAKMATYVSDTSGNEDMDEQSEESQESDVSNNISLKSDVQSPTDKINEKVEYDSDDYSNPDQNPVAEFENSNIEADTETVSPRSSESEYNESISKDVESNSNDDEQERCYVNTRRRVTIKYNSNKLSLDNSSSASSECDKTVLSNNKFTINSSHVKEIYHNEIFVPDEEAKIKSSLDSNSIDSNAIDCINLDSDEVEEKMLDSRISFITTRKSSRKLSTLPRSPVNLMDTKPTIVLQPGKKWERSLSIYRRMTMMNDNFERSILTDESMNCKGRKYRQSVLSTMEMQEGFLSDDCDDTIVELSKLSIADSDHDITVVDKVHGDRLTTARDYVLRRCNQTDAILFDECYPDPLLKNCHKIGEGVYGEVFLWRARDGRARVMKIVPVAGTTKVNGENQKDFHEIISEIVIAMELSAIRTPIADLERKFDEGKDVDALELHAIQNATDVFNELPYDLCYRNDIAPRPFHLAREIFLKTET